MDPRKLWLVEAADGKSGLEIWTEQIMPIFGSSDNESLAKGETKNSLKRFLEKMKF